MSSDISVFHLSKGSALPLSRVLGGGEEKKMTPEVAANLDVLNSPLSCWIDPTSAETEVTLIGRELDVLARALIPGTGDDVLVAIENQFGNADPDHLGRLVGWYMPEAEAEMGVLIAEDFDPHLVRAVDEGDIIRPRHGLWLVEAKGYKLGEQRLVHYALRATSLARDELLARQKAFNKNLVSAPGGPSPDLQVALSRVERMFSHIATTGTGELSKLVGAARTVSRFYRKLVENEHTCHLAIAVNKHRISFGSSYHKHSKLGTETLDQLTDYIKNGCAEPEPSKRELRSAWWTVAEVGWMTPEEDWPTNLGKLLDDQFASLKLGMSDHNARLVEIIESAPPVEQRI